MEIWRAVLRREFHAARLNQFSSLCLAKFTKGYKTKEYKRECKSVVVLRGPDSGAPRSEDSCLLAKLSFVDLIQSVHLGEKKAKRED